MTTLSAQITATGISAPDYADIFAQLQNAFWQIYGTDADLSSDSQDGQFLAIFAQAIYDNNQLAIAIYNAYSPNFAQGAGLSSVVKINGIRRKSSSFSTATITCVGTYGVAIVGGAVGDNLNLGTQWTLDNFTFPVGGSIAVTATCTTPGATTAAPSTLTSILTPSNGWNSATNASAAVVGQPVEVDAALRQRQSKSTSLPALTVLESIFAAVANVEGVGRSYVYNNDTNATDGNGVPAHSICAVVEGGDAVLICEAIAAYKAPGVGTYGSTTEIVVDSNGVPDPINFYELDEIVVTVDITVQPLSSWVSSTATLIQESVLGFLSGLGVGEDDYLNRLFGPANLSGDAALTATGMTQQQLDALSATYNVTSITQAIGSGAQAPADIVISFNEAVSSSGNAVNITVT